MSGAEVLWDLDYRGDAADRTFAEEVLGALMESDDAEVTTATGSGVLEGISVDFSVEGGGLYHVEYPDVLNTSRSVVLSYPNGDAATLDEGVFFMGFPFECIGSAATRYEIMSRVMAVLLPNYEPEDVAEAEPGQEPSQDDPLYTFDKEDGTGPKGCTYLTPVDYVLFLLPSIFVITRRRYVL